MNDWLQRLTLFVPTGGSFSRTAREFGLVLALGVARRCGARAPIGRQAPRPHHASGLRHRRGRSSARTRPRRPRKLESARRLFIAAPSYLANRGAPVSFADLAWHDVISRPSDIGGETWAARRNGRIERQTLSPRVRSHSATGVVACAAAGLGLAVGSIWMCAEALASGAVVEILTDYALDPIQAYVVFPAGRRPSQKARAFSDHFDADSRGK
jgi:DNA-binding transcriptional LysR family regulator